MEKTCISCKHFTVTPRHERKDMDESYRSKGFGRCRIDRETARWVRAEALRECINLVAIDTAEIEARQRHLAKHQSPSST